jgi:ammonia channel protein AmtB
MSGGCAGLIGAKILGERIGKKEERNSRHQR